MKKNFIGIDVSKLTLDVYLHNQSQHNVFSNDIDGFTKMLAWLKQLKVSVKSMAICFEHTGIYSEDLSVFLSEKKVCFYMESSLNIKYSIGLQRGKNDKIDSKRIANYIALHADQLSPAILSKSAVAQLRKLLSMRSHLEKEKIGIMYRDVELHGKPCPGSSHPQNPVSSSICNIIAVASRKSCGSKNNHSSGGL